MVKPKKRGRKLGVSIGPYKKSNIALTEIDIVKANLKYLIQLKIKYLNKLLRSL